MFVKTLIIYWPPLFGAFETKVVGNEFGIFVAVAIVVAPL